MITQAIHSTPTQTNNINDQMNTKAVDISSQLGSKKEFSHIKKAHYLTFLDGKFKY